MVSEDETDEDSSKEQDNQGRFSKALRKPIGALRPEFRSEAERKAERIDEEIRRLENKRAELASKSRFVVGREKERIERIRSRTLKQIERVKARSKREVERATNISRRIGQAKGIRGKLHQSFKEFRSIPSKLRIRILTTEFPELAAKIGKPLLEPKFIPERFFDVPRTAQWLAAAFLPIIIIVSMAIIVAIQEIIEDVLLNSGDLGDQSTIFQFVSTFISLAPFCLGIWSWFLWVRTGGFKQFDH